MNKILCLILILLISSCRFVYHRAPHYLKAKGYTFRYTGQSTNLSKQLKLNGYYFDPNDRHAKDPYSGYGLVYFFDDGMVVRCVSPLGPPETSLEDNLRVMDSLRRLDKLYVYFEEQQEWGYYKLIGDTIKVQFVKRPELGGSARFWSASEIEFLIVNAHNVRRVSSLSLNKPGLYEAPPVKQHIPEQDQWKGAFVAAVTPSPDGWLKYEKWFWKDKSSYKRWKKI